MISEWLTAVWEWIGDQEARELIGGVVGAVFGSVVALLLWLHVKGLDR